MPTHEEIYDQSHAALLQQLRNAVLATAGTGLAVGAGVSGLNWLQNSGLSSGEPKLNPLPVPIPRERSPGSLAVDRQGKLLPRHTAEEDEEKVAAVGALQAVTAKQPIPSPTTMPGMPRVTNPKLMNTAGPMNNPLAATIKRRPTAMPMPAQAPMPGMKQADSAAANTGSMAGSAIWNALNGRYARSMMGMPLALPALAATGGLSVMAGDKLMDMAAGSMNKSRRKSEEEEAEEAYRAALLSQYANKAAGYKQADAQATAVKLGQAMDTVFDFLERTLPQQKVSHQKTASAWSRIVGDVPGMMAGGVLGVGALTGLGSAIAAYQLGKKHSGRSLLEEAVKERKRQLAASGASTTFAIPQPVEEEDEKAKLTRI